MKRRKGMAAMLLMLAMLLCSSVTVCAAAKENVTGTKKSSVTKFLKPYAEYLAYPLISEDEYKEVKFDNVYKTNMILYTHLDLKKYTDKSVAKVKKQYQPKIRQVFGKSSKFKLKKTKTQKYPTLFANISGKVKYVGGDWGETLPYGKVGKVYQTGKRKYLVNYKIYLGSYGQKKSAKDYAATYKISLKQSGASYVITNVKLA